MPAELQWVRGHSTNHSTTHSPLVKNVLEKKNPTPDTHNHSHIQPLLTQVTGITPRSSSKTNIAEMDGDEQARSGSSSPEFSPLNFGEDFAPLPEYKAAGDAALDFSGLLEEP